MSCDTACKDCPGFLGKYPSNPSRAVGCDNNHLARGVGGSVIVVIQEVLRVLALSSMIEAVVS